MEKVRREPEVKCSLGGGCAYKGSGMCDKDCVYHPDNKKGEKNELAKKD